MDFELLAEKPKPPSLLMELEQLIINRKAFFQRRLQTPPHVLGLIVLATVVVEFALNAALRNETGLGRPFLTHLAFSAACILGVELALTAITHQLAGLFGSTGQTNHLMTFLNLGLMPLTIYLPISLLSWLSGQASNMRLLLLLLLLLQVVATWRESIELTYKLSKLQSTLAIYALSAAGFCLLIAAAYFLLFNKLAGLFL